MLRLDTQGWRSHFPSSDAELTQAGARGGLRGGGQRGNTLSSQGRNLLRWRNRFSTGETVQLRPPSPGASAPPGGRAGRTRCLRLRSAGATHLPFSGVPLSLDGSGASP